MIPALSAWLARRLLDRRDGHRERVWQAYIRQVNDDRLSADERVFASGHRLAALLEHARTRVPFFQDCLREAPPVTGANAWDILARCPVLPRVAIQQDPSRFQCSEIPARDDATGGSTGTPLRFKVDSATQIEREASLLWADQLSGWRPGDRIAMLWGSDKDVQNASRAIRTKLRCLIENRRWFNAFDMGPAQMEVFHREMGAFRPHLLVAYAGSLDVFARWLEQSGLKPDYPLTAMISSAEMLLPAVRHRAERVFGRPVFDRYGNREAGAIAAECRVHDGLHINEEDFHLEVLSADPTRVPGPLLLTYYWNRAMPLIRYDTGDLAVLCPPGPCSCGRSTRRVARIVGRQSDTIRTRSGRWIHGEFFTHLMYGEAAVRSFQFVQETLDRYRLCVEGDAARCASREAEWMARIRAEVGADACVEIKYVDAIPTTASGKRKFTLSRLCPENGVVATS